MVTKGIITSIDFNGNTCQVRIPLFETAGNDPIISTAVVSNTPGSYNGYKVDDVVLVAFEDGKMETPVVIGKLYLGAEKEKADPRGSLNTESLVAAKTAAVPADTKLTTDTDKNLPNTMNPYANLSSIANNLNKLNTDVNYLDVFTNNQFKSVITDVNKQGEQLRSEIKQTSSNIEAKVDKEHDSTTTGLGWNLTDTKWTIDATNTAWSHNKLTLFEVDRNGQVIINGNVRIGGYPQSRTRFYKKLAADAESPKAPDMNTATEKLPDEGWYETYKWENTYHIWETIQTIIYDKDDDGELQLKITYSTPVDITGAAGEQGISIKSQIIYYAMVDSDITHVEKPDYTPEVGDNQDNHVYGNSADNNIIDLTAASPVKGYGWSTTPHEYIDGWNYYTSVLTIYSDDNQVVSPAINHRSFADPVKAQELDGVYELAQGKSKNYYSETNPAGVHGEPTYGLTMREGYCWFDTGYTQISALKAKSDYLGKWLRIQDANGDYVVKSGENPVRLIHWKDGITDQRYNMIKVDPGNIDTLIKNKTIIVGTTEAFETGNLKQWDGTDWVDISGELVTNKLTANYINALDITAKKITVLDKSNNKTLFEADGINGNGSVKIANFTVKNDKLYSDKHDEIDSPEAGIYLGSKGLSIGSKFKVTADSVEISDYTKSTIKKYRRIEYDNETDASTHYADWDNWDSSEWLSIIPNREEGKYIWEWTKEEKGNNRYNDLGRVCITGAKGDKGNPGEQGYSIVASVSRPSFTEANWNTYGSIGHLEIWSDTSAIRNGCRVGDIFTVVGTATDTKNAHVLYYKSTTASGNLVGTCFSHSVAERGNKGEAGNGISSITNYYLVSNNNSGIVNTSGDWKTVPPTTDSANKYLWNYVLITYTNSGTTKTTPCIIGVHGEKGDPGATGRSVSSVTKYYKLATSEPGKPSSKNPSILDSEGWKTTPPVWQSGRNYYESDLTIYDDDTFSWSEVIENSMLTVDFINSLGITAKKITVLQDNSAEGSAENPILFQADGINGNGEVKIGGFTVDSNRLYTGTPGKDDSIEIAKVHNLIAYKSNNQGKDSTSAVCKIKVNKDITNLTVYIRSYAETNRDYMIISTPNAKPRPNAYTDNYVKAHTKGNQKSGSTLADYTKVEYDGLKQDNYIYVVYKKDGSISSGTDTGYLLIPETSDISISTVDGENYTFERDTSLDIKEAGASLKVGSNFSVDSTGAIKSTSGTIGGFEVTSDDLHTAGATIGNTGSLFLSSNGVTNNSSIGGSTGAKTWSITAGSNFGVTKGGTVYANDMVITGYTDTISIGGTNSDPNSASMHFKSNFESNSTTNAGDCDIRTNEIKNTGRLGYNIVFEDSEDKRYSASISILADKPTISEPPFIEAAWDQGIELKTYNPADKDSGALDNNAALRIGYYKGNSVPGEATKDARGFLGDVWCPTGIFRCKNGNIVPYIYGYKSGLSESGLPNNTYSDKYEYGFYFEEKQLDPDSWASWCYSGIFTGISCVIVSLGHGTKWGDKRPDTRPGHLPGSAATENSFYFIDANNELVYWCNDTSKTWTVDVFIVGYKQRAAGTFIGDQSGD